MVTSCFNYEDTLEAVKENIQLYMKKDGPGTILLCYSCLLSRTPELVTTDMDSNFGLAPKMIGNHGYANQEFVNLFLTGAATSNLFDGVKTFADETDAASTDQITMGGIASQGQVGFLTLFEAYKSLEVGTHLKDPVYPVWVVCSESHYSTLFSPDPDHIKVKDGTQNLDIYYYDPLGEQEDVRPFKAPSCVPPPPPFLSSTNPPLQSSQEIKLTLDSEAEGIPEDGGDETDLIPPIDKVVRTKWGSVGVDWNGVEPIL